MSKAVQAEGVAAAQEKFKREQEAEREAAREAAIQKEIDRLAAAKAGKNPKRGTNMSGSRGSTVATGTTGKNNDDGKKPVKPVDGVIKDEMEGEAGPSFEGGGNARQVGEGAPTVIETNNPEYEPIIMPAEKNKQLGASA